MRGLSFIVDNELFVVDITLVQKVARRMTVTPIQTAPDAVIGIANMKGSVITLLSLFELLGRKERRGKDRNAETVNAVIFKSLSSREDQMGLIIDKPGGLIDIDEDSIRPPAPLTGAAPGPVTGATPVQIKGATPVQITGATPVQITGVCESFCISGLADIGDRLYRIISIDAIIRKYDQYGE